MTRIKGERALERKLTRTIPKAVRANLRAALEKSADEIVALAKRFVPVDSGALRDSIGWTWGDAPDGSVSVAESVAWRGEKITIYAGSRKAFYAAWVEFGTQTASAHPFFFPAYRFRKRTAKGRITRAIRKGLKQGSKGRNK